MIKYREIIISLLALSLIILVAGCNVKDTQETKDRIVVNRQQEQYAKGQPIPSFDWSLERALLLQLYNIRNSKVATHAVWRSDYGLIEGDCPCMGYGLPYDTSLTNPLTTTDEDPDGTDHQDLATIEQPEPNGVFPSKNTSATWVMCVGESGIIEPMFIESKVTVYPGPVKVDYEKNRVTRVGVATVTIQSPVKPSK